MSAKIIDGKQISALIKEQVAKDALECAKYRRAPSLAVIIVGENPASQIYVKNKKKACEACNIKSIAYELPGYTRQEELLELINKLNKDKFVDGILCQLPLPEHIDEEAVINAISPEKDVDGFHPISTGNLLTGGKGFLPCTPAGIIQLLKYSDIPIAGKHCVIIGRSNIVGKPAALLMLRENATVTICHSRTANLKEIVLSADIVIAAVGKEKFVTADMIKPGATVIDVGINRNAEGKVCGDVDFENVKEVAGAITPVPGGVGPMTIAMLMKNTLEAYNLHPYDKAGKYDLLGYRRCVELFTKYNKDPFHIRHAVTVAEVMYRFAKKYAGVGEADFWKEVGFLHDIDFELYPEEHCKKAPELLKEAGASDALIHAVCSHGFGICSDVEPEEFMEKVLFAVDELTGLIWSYSLMRESRSCKDMELSGLKKKFKDKKFAAGCSREIIQKGALRLEWDISDLLKETMQAMADSEDDINETCKRIIRTISPADEK